MKYMEIAFGYMWDLVFLGANLDILSITGSILIASVVFVVKPSGHGGDDGDDKKDEGKDEKKDGQ